jgi:hypothetical protein
MHEIFFESAEVLGMEAFPNHLNFFLNRALSADANWSLSTNKRIGDGRASLIGTNR